MYHSFLLKLPKEGHDFYKATEKQQKISAVFIGFYDFLFEGLNWEIEFRQLLDSL